MIRCWNVTAEVSPLGYSRSPLGELWLWESLVSPAQLHTPPLILSPHTVTKSSRALELHQHTIPDHDLPPHHLKDFTRSQVSLKFSYCVFVEKFSAQRSQFFLEVELSPTETRAQLPVTRVAPPGTCNSYPQLFCISLQYLRIWISDSIFCILDFDLAFDILCLIFYIFVCVCTSVLYLCFIEQAIKWIVPRILVYTLKQKNSFIPCPCPGWLSCWELATFHPVTTSWTEF